MPRGQRVEIRDATVERGRRVARPAALRAGAYAIAVLPAATVLPPVVHLAAVVTACALGLCTVDGRPVHSAVRSWLRLQVRGGRSATFRAASRGERLGR